MHDNGIEGISEEEYYGFFIAKVFDVAFMLFDYVHVITCKGYKA